MENGAVVVSGTASGPSALAGFAAAGTGENSDLGDVILLPGLINAHCHLDYTGMAGMLPPPKTFTDWIPLIMAARAGWDCSDYGRSWLNGARMLVCSGTTTVADIETVPDLLPEVWNATPLRVFSFLEMTGIRARRDRNRFCTRRLKKSIHSPSALLRLLSPHAPYSTVPELLDLSAARRPGTRLAVVHPRRGIRNRNWTCSMSACGEMFRWMRRNARDMSDCGLGSPVRHLARHGMLGGNLLAIHVNCLARGDAALLGQHHVHVVHCPRSHDYFRHPPFAQTAGQRRRQPLPRHRQPGHRPQNQETKPRTQHVRRNARAGGQRSETAAGGNSAWPRSTARARWAVPARSGSFRKMPWRISLPSPPARKPATPAEAVLAHDGPVSASMIDGDWVIPPE